jgi:hypothetical protein
MPGRQRPGRRAQAGPARLTNSVTPELLALAAGRLESMPRGTR